MPDINHMAVVQPGVTLDQLDAQLAPLGLVYPVFPGEYSASIGGNVNTNAGGMRAVKYGVTRHHVLGLELVLASGDVIRTGGKFVKATSLGGTGSGFHLATDAETGNKGEFIDMQLAETVKEGLVFGSEVSSCARWGRLKLRGSRKVRVR